MTAVAARAPNGAPGSRTRVRVRARGAAEVRTRQPHDSPRRSLHVLTCGSVDDGKSTLIGRLLWDTAGLPADQREQLERSPKTAAGTPDFSLLVDGLAAEREQGITIDIAWRYFDTPARRLVIIDSPGHEQYTRNMATGASHADVAILLVDARSGVKEQTRRHAAILDLMGVTAGGAGRQQDGPGGLVEPTRFGDDRSGVPEAGRPLRLRAMRRPSRSRRCWATTSRSSSLRHALVSTARRCSITCGHAGARRSPSDGEFRFPFSWWCAPARIFAAWPARSASGSIAVGDEVIEPVGGRRAQVQRIVTMGRDLERARAGQAVVLQLDSDIDVSRGAVLALARARTAGDARLDARLVWLSDEQFAPAEATSCARPPTSSRSRLVDIRAHLDLETLTERPASTCASNDIAVARIDLGRRAAIDLFADQRETGSFMLIDPITGASVAGGVVTATRICLTKQRAGQTCSP